MSESKRLLLVGHKLELSQFTSELVGDPAMIARLVEIWDVAAPQSKSVIDKESHVLDTLHWDRKTITDQPTPEFVERKLLWERVEPVIRDALGSSEFVSSGRFPDRFERTDIDRRMWKSISIDLKRNEIGSPDRRLVDVTVQRASISEDEALFDFVVASLSKLQKGDVTKPTLFTLAQVLENYEVTKAMFDRAWERAVLQIKNETGVDWSSRGRRHSRN